jgi:hypothetical protein
VVGATLRGGLGKEQISAVLCQHPWKSSGAVWEDPAVRGSSWFLLMTFKKLGRFS